MFVMGNSITCALVRNHSIAVHMVCYRYIIVHIMYKICNKE